MAREPRYRLDGPVGLLAAGILSTAIGIAAIVMVSAGDLASSNTRGWFFALLGVPLGVVLTVVGIVRMKRSRR